MVYVGTHAHENFVVGFTVRYAIADTLRDCCIAINPDCTACCCAWHSRIRAPLCTSKWRNTYLDLHRPGHLRLLLP
jgi:hypothetical protein